jgi:plastocyanin
MPIGSVRGRAMAMGVAMSVTGLALSALAAGDAPSADHDAVVIMKNFDFQPMEIAIPAGASVTWRNLDGEPHTVTSTDGAFRSGALDQNDTYTFRFAKPGVYRYVCSIHPKMTARVIVR